MPVLIEVTGSDRYQGDGSGLYARVVDSATEDSIDPIRGSRVAVVAGGVVALVAALIWWDIGYANAPVDCDSKFVVELPDSAENVECHSKDSHDARWHFTMPTDEAESWWAGQSETRLDLATWLLTGGTELSSDGDIVGRVSGGVSVYYPEDEGGLLVVNPRADGMSQVVINGSWH
ncbi:hypothetical protein LHJ74_13570 [Streptomyces sp. N2-109]|uniref:Uncharacterized protein n=1 Tax=Streptomyces gossypii TaxID=2883101 RepID=A0ABT2JSV9_9ACTN|nr:hypothetical protein [Streptomyces gossypii]MCT2590926.1 hypothetical protein [Streptomyces gossypii]